MDERRETPERTVRDEFLKSFVAQHHQNTETKREEDTTKETETTPSWMRPIFAITVRDHRYTDLLNRLGPLWRMNVVKWSGTIGMKIDRNSWLLKQRIRNHCRLTPGQLGCYDSHVRLWRDCVQSGRPTFIVEDDVNLTPNETITDSLKTFWRRVEDEKLDYDFIYIGHNNKYKPKLYVTHFVDDPNIVVPHGCQGLFAYLVTPKGASFLLDKCIPYEQPVDVYVQHRLENDRENKFKCYAMYPSPFYVVDVESDTR